MVLLKKENNFGALRGVPAEGVAEKTAAKRGLWS